MSTQLPHVDTISECFIFNLQLNKLNCWQSVEKEVIVVADDCSLYDS